MNGLTLSLADTLAIFGTLVGLGGYVIFAFSKLHGRINRVRDELAEHKIAVAEKYVSAENMVRTEERLIAAINGLAKKIDRITEGR